MQSFLHGEAWDQPNTGPYDSFAARPQIALLRAARSSDAVHKRLDATAERIVALTAPEEQYLYFHGLRLPALVDELKQKSAGCGLAR